MITKRRNFTAIILSVLLILSSLVLIFGNLQTKKSKADPIENESDYFYYVSDTHYSFLNQTQIAQEFPNYLIRKFTEGSSTSNLSGALQEFQESCSVSSFFETPTTSGITQVQSGNLPNLQDGSISDAVIVLEITNVLPNGDYLETFCYELKNFGFKIMIIGAFDSSYYDNWSEISENIDVFEKLYYEKYFFDLVIADIKNNRSGLAGASFILDPFFVNFDNSIEVFYAGSSFIRYLVEVYATEFSLTGDEATIEYLLQNNYFKLFTHNSGTGTFTQISVNIQDNRLLNNTILYTTASDLDNLPAPRYLISLCPMDTYLYDIAFDIQRDPYEDVELYLLTYTGCTIDPDGELEINLLYDRTSANASSSSSSATTGLVDGERVAKVQAIISQIEALFATE